MPITMGHGDTVLLKTILSHDAGLIVLSRSKYLYPIGADWSVVFSGYIVDFVYLEIY